MGTALAQARWTPVGVWGHDGWDLGSWPLVVVSVTEGESVTDGYLYGMRVNTEGDIERSWYTTSEARDRAISAWARWWYSNAEDKPASMTALSCLNGPYRQDYRSNGLCPECRAADAQKAQQ